ncbi:MAG: competence/damage-inducible protein A [Bacteroidetes bacterium]|nr:competence/damage-inducible protein A [Bacteroidota bacterium]
MEKVFASIITIGDELLIGQVIDTNSAWIAGELNQIGILLKHRIAVGDNREDILEALETEGNKSKIVIITGGLGPTADDITKPVLCEYFGGKMILHEPTLAHIRTIFEKVLKRPMIERNQKQAEVPDVCTVLMNEQGTAPGMLFEKNGVWYISLPGVPHEMKWLMQEKVLPLLSEKFSGGVVVHRTLLTAGLGESFLAEMIQDIELSLPAHIKLAYLPNYGMVRLRLSGWGNDTQSLTEEIVTFFNLLKERVKDYLIIDEDIPLERAIGKLLVAQKATVATAESCTGGYIAHLLTSHAGASAFFKGSVICYDNEIKKQLLGVTEACLQQFGAVSSPTVEQMATAVRELLQVDYALAVSGIMGPDGGSPEKPLGLVWVAIAGPKGVKTQELRFRFTRKRNIELTAAHTLRLLHAAIVENK